MKTPSALLALYDDTMRRNARAAGYVREANAFTSRYTATSGSLRFILWHQFEASDVESLIDAELTSARGCASSLMWKVYAHDTPASALEARLVARGFAQEEPSTLMIASVESVNALLESKAQNKHALNVRELTTAQSLDAYQSIWDDVWPDSPNARYVNDYRELVAQRNPGVVFFAGYASDDEPVTSGYMFHHPNDPISLLCGGATKSKARGRGAYAHMLLARAKTAQARGAQHLAVEASAESEPILKRLGFIELSKLAFYEYDFGKIGSTTANVD
jgi:hypothetical protein